MKKIKVLLTGADGQLGKSILELAEVQANIEFIATNKKILDITNVNMLELFIKKYNPEIILNCAAYTSVDKAEIEKDLAMQVNYDGIKNLSRLSNKRNIKLIHVSTDYVFDGKKQTAYVEDDYTNPLNTYGKSKQLSEEYLQENNSQYWIIRTAWLYSMFGKNFLKAILAKLKDDNIANFNVVSDQVGTPTYTANVAEVLFYFIKNLQHIPIGLYHYSDASEKSWYELACIIQEQFSLLHNNQQHITEIVPIPTNTIKFDNMAIRPQRSSLSNSKINGIINNEICLEQNLHANIKKLITLLDNYENRH